MSDTNGEYRKYRKQTGPGKGDARRPGDDKAYADGWERIWGKKKKSARRHHYRAEEGFPCPCGKPIDDPIHIPQI